MISDCRLVLQSPISIQRSIQLIYYGSIHYTHFSPGRAARQQRGHRSDHPGAVLESHRQSRTGRIAVCRLALQRRRITEARLHLESTAGAGRGDFAGRRQLRLRLIARTCAVGVDGLRLPRGDQHVVRRHLPQQLAEERPAARHRRCGDPSVFAGSRSKKRPTPKSRSISLRRRSPCPADKPCRSPSTVSPRRVCSTAWTSWATF